MIIMLCVCMQPDSGAAEDAEMTEPEQELEEVIIMLCLSCDCCVCVVSCDCCVCVVIITP